MSTHGRVFDRRLPRVDPSTSRGKGRGSAISDRCHKCGQRYAYCVCHKKAKPAAFPWDPYPEVL